MVETAYSDLTLERALRLASPEDMDMQRELVARLSSLSTEMEMFRQFADRFDELYFATTIGPWGADLWADDPSATTPGRSHVSVNTPSVYVTVPAALQSVPPIENMRATEDSPEARHAANALERVRKAWKIEEKWQLKRQKAATVKSLYGRTASFTYYDKAEGRPCAKIVENPRNLWLGYKGDDYTAVEWAAYSTLMDPSAVTEKFSVDFDARQDKDGKIVPWIMGIGDVLGRQAYPELTFGAARVEVWDYWYRLPAKKKGKRGEPTKMETWNVVIAGNAIIRGPFKYPEYNGRIPYRPLTNSFIPGTPFGRSDLHDMEMLIREKMARITAGAQMIAGATAGDYWQITGENAPARGYAQIKPKRNETVSAGPGNRIEAIQPFVMQFQLEQFLGRLDREMAIISGLNDLLLGLAPVQALNSSKAINALLANYETRLSMSRQLFYEWDIETWNDVLEVWQKYDSTVKEIVDAGGGTLDLQDPSLSPKDEMETANRAAALVGAKLWSLARGMDAVGVEDPEQEQNIIREERTDATLFPESVQVMAQLMGVLQSMGLGAPQGAQQQVAGQASSGAEALQSALGAQVPENGPGQQGVEGQLGAPAVEGGGNSPFAQGPQGFAGGNMETQVQGMIQGGEAKGRIMTNTKLGRR